MEAYGVAQAERRLLLLLPLLVAVSLALAPHDRAEAVGGGGGGRACTYAVKVRTSCASPAQTGDAVSVAFGDAYRNEAYGARLSGPPATFGRCGTDTFRVSGQCGYGVCYLYLRRAGRDGWAPEWVQVFEPGASASDKPATFYFGDPLPDGVWYGHNRCPKAVATPETNASASPLG